MIAKYILSTLTMSMDWRTVDIADQPAFACDPDDKAWVGMTYKQWLVGQALMGAMSNPEYLSQTTQSITDDIMIQVESILDKMRTRRIR